MEKLDLRLREIQVGFFSLSQFGLLTPATCSYTNSYGALLCGRSFRIDGAGGACVCVHTQHTTLPQLLLWLVFWPSPVLTAPASASCVRVFSVDPGAWCEQATESIGKVNGLDLTHCVSPTDISTECTDGRLTRDAIRQPGPLVNYA